MYKIENCSHAAFHEHELAVQCKVFLENKCILIFRIVLYCSESLGVIAYCQNKNYTFECGDVEKEA